MPRDQSKSGKSWLLGLLSHWTRHDGNSSRPSSPPPPPGTPTPQSNTPDDDPPPWLAATTATAVGTHHRHSDDDSCNTRRSSLSTTGTTGTADKADATSHSARSSLHCMRPQSRPQHRRTSLLPSPRPSGSPSSERRNSQQTTASSVLSDDQYSSYSGCRRDSDDRSILRDLWSKARRHHPHYPTFHWPRLPHRRHRPSISHHSNHDGIHTSAGSSPGTNGTPRPSHDDPLSTIRLVSSYQDINQHPLSLHRHHQPQNKRHSITSMISGDNGLTSRPASAFSSQSASPNLNMILKAVPVYDDNMDDDIDPYLLDDNMSRRVRWAVKPELVQLAIEDGSLFCDPLSISPSAVAAEKHILQLGCGDGTWAMDLALDYPKWIVVGMEDRDGGPCANRRTAPRNFRFVRCQESMLEGIKLIPDDTFDLVHCRFLALSYPADQYQALVQECWRVCKPGGYVELIEMDMRIYPSRMVSAPLTQTFNSEVIHVMEDKSLDPRLARRLKDILANLTHQDRYYAVYQAHYISLPLGLWGGRIGVMFRDDVHDLFEVFQPSVAEYYETPLRTDQELDIAFDVMNDEMERQRSFMNLHYAFAQKVERALC